MFHHNNFAWLLSNHLRYCARARVCVCVCVFESKSKYLDTGSLRQIYVRTTMTMAQSVNMTTYQEMGNQLNAKIETTLYLFHLNSFLLKLQTELCTHFQICNTLMANYIWYKKWKKVKTQNMLHQYMFLTK